MSLRPPLALPERIRLPALLVVGVVVMAVGVWVASSAQRTAATREANESRHAQLMLTAMLDQETGLRGYLLTRRKEFLVPYDNGRKELEIALVSARNAARGEGPLLRLIDRQASLAREWQSLAASEVSAPRPVGHASSISAALVRKSYMDRFRAVNSSFQKLVEDQRADQFDQASVLTVGITLGLGLLFGTFGTLLIRRARLIRERDKEFAESLQVMRSESEAHTLLAEHIERSVGGGLVTVLTRNNSGDRLAPSTDLDENDPLREPLGDAEPGSCLAARLARPHARSERAEPLMGCELCGKAAGASTCQPLIVGGEVLGSVLLRKKSRVSASDSDKLAQSVSRAAPALANLRNLAVAEARAETDPLTSLANKRAIQDTLKRMHAHAMRTADPLSVIVVDLDHFKRINDTYGHDTGDAALAGAAEALVATVRGSDFVGRMGGEEFIVLLPDTDADDAAAVAEKLRVAIGTLMVPNMPDRLTASFGVATYPLDAVESDDVLRLADRALYLAKKLGRNRVQHATSEDLPHLSGDPT